MSKSTPSTYAKWIMTAAAENGKGLEQDLDVLAVFMLLQTIAATSTITMTATNIFLDLLSSQPSHQYYSALRDEARAAYADSNTALNTSVFKALVKTDSTIRETLRLKPVLIPGMTRKVVSPNGITFPDGTHLSEGTWLSTHILGIDTSKENYRSPTTYLPFRFAATTASSDSKNHQSAEASELSKNPALANTLPPAHIPSTAMSPTFVSFGLGKHSCAGKELASHILNLLVSYITLHYDIQYLSSRPTGMRFGDTNLPSLSTVIRVRRRKIEVEK